MADSKLQNPDEESDEELVHCGICFAIIDKPRALPCLHTFCQNCLTSWSESSAKKQPDKYTDVISCPSCREEFPLPEGGVQNLRSNFFVTKLKERKSIQRKLQSKDANIPCTSCTEASDQGTAVARCVECNDFLCDRCVEVHKSVRVLKRHQLLTLDELRSGKLAIHNLPEQETCSKHKGEILRFYCETCDEPMCRDCSVIDHPRPDHKQVDIESIAKERAEHLQKLAKECEPQVKKLESAIEADERIKNDLDGALEKAMIAIEKTTDAAVTRVVEALKKAGTAKKDELQQLTARRKKEIEFHKENLDLMRIRIHTALETTHQVTQKGSEHDIATMYSSLNSTMNKICSVEPTAIRKSFAKVGFKPNENLVTIINEQGVLGTVQRYDQWVLERNFGEGQFTSPKYIVFTDTGDIAITEHNYSRSSVTVFGSGHNDAQVKLSIQPKGVRGSEYTGYCQPWGLTIGKDGQYFVTDLNPHVKVFDVGGNFKHRFKTMNVEGSYTRSKLYGLAIDHKGRVFVGSDESYISIHDQDGSHLASFKIKICPYFIAATPNGHILVSDHITRDPTVHVYDDTGSHLHTFSPPEEARKWCPTGTCCYSENVVFVAGKSPIPAVYRYSMTGEYLGVVTKELTDPWGIAIRGDDDELLVVDQNVVKVFQMQ